MTWLLFAAPLLVPILWHAALYFPQDVRLHSEETIGQQEMILRLSNTLYHHPYSQTFDLANFNKIEDVSYDFEYNRSIKQLNVHYHLYRRETKSWNRVTDAMIHRLAESTQDVVNARPFFWSKSLEVQGAKLIGNSYDPPTRK